MSGPTGVPSFMVAWLEAQQALTRLAGATFENDPAASASPLSLGEPYRQLFAMAGCPLAGPATAAPDATLRRYQQAVERVGRLVNEAATDAGRRLAAALAADGPDAVPIISLRDLRSIWIDCGEAAWSAVAHREEFAEAQAELLAAWAGLRAAGPAA